MNSLGGLAAGQLRTGLDRASPQRWQIVDFAVAIGLTAGALSVLGGLHDSAPPLLVGVAAGVCTTTVAWRRRSPVAAALVALTAVLVYQRLSQDTQGAFEPVAIVLSCYTAGRAEIRRGRWRRLAGLLGYALAVAALIDAGGPGFTVFSLVLSWAPIAVLPVAAAFVVERRKNLNVRLADTAIRLRDEQAASANQAAACERNRVARELHDVVAHSVSVMVIQAGAARLIAADDVAGARDALALVVSSGRDALGDLRRVMGVLRRDDALEASSQAAPAGLANLDRLIEVVRATGLDTTLQVTGTRVRLAADVDLAAYRVAQEALTNAAKHAGPAVCEVHVRYRSDGVELEILDTGRGDCDGASLVAGAGQGLIGMRERVAMCGGQLQVGSREDLGGTQGVAHPNQHRGYRVRAWLPADPGYAVDPPALALPLRGLVPPWLARWSDLVFAALSLAVLEAAAVSYGRAHGWLLYNSAVAIVISLACLWRRRMPLLFLLVVSALGLAAHGLAPPDKTTVVGTYIVLVPVYSVASWASRRKAMAGLAAWLAGAVAITALRGALSVGLLGAALMAVLAWGAGRVVRRQRELAAQLVATTSRLTAEREQRAELAVAEERARLARQLQDQVAQLVVAMVVQAEAASQLLNGEPDHAVGSIAAVEATGRHALARMRTILGVLRNPAVRPPRLPEGALA